MQGQPLVEDAGTAEGRLPCSDLHVHPDCVLLDIHHRLGVTGDCPGVTWSILKHEMHPSWSLSENGSSSVWRCPKSTMMVKLDFLVGQPGHDSIPSTVIKSCQPSIPSDFRVMTEAMRKRAVGVSSLVCTQSTQVHTSGTYKMSSAEPHLPPARCRPLHCIIHVPCQSPGARAGMGPAAPRLLTASLFWNYPVVRTCGRIHRGTYLHGTSPSF